jgi:hypothetical protein
VVETGAALSVTKDTTLGNLLPIERFLLALKAPETKRQYPKRLESFFIYLQIEGSFEQKTMWFYSMIKAQQESEWLTNQLLKYLSYQKESS